MIVIPGAPIGICRGQQDALEPAATSRCGGCLGHHDEATPLLITNIELDECPIIDPIANGTVGWAAGHDKCRHATLSGHGSAVTAE